jgi:hypothetical protein
MTNCGTPGEQTITASPLGQITLGGTEWPYPQLIHAPPAGGGPRAALLATQPRPEPDSQRVNTPVPVGLDPGTALSAQYDLQDVGHSASRDAEPHVQARRTHRSETG